MEEASMTFTERHLEIGRKNFEKSGRSAVDVLQRARDLIERGFCRGCYAMDRSPNGVVRFDSNEAECFCAVGALANVLGDLSMADYVATTFLAPHIPGGSWVRHYHVDVRAWSDSVGQVEVLRVFDLAINKRFDTN
jgi:hypothetical protein